MQLASEVFTLRPLQMADAESMAQHANNRKVWLNLRDRFPHPYSLEDARSFLETVVDQEPTLVFAIEVEGEVAGTIGLTPGVGDRHLTAELGYWLGEPYWNQGIVTAAVKSTSAYAVDELGFLRIEAHVFAWNPASARVLEKAGFTYEGTLRKSMVKDGMVIDRHMYALVASD